MRSLLQEQELRHRGLCDLPCLSAQVLGTPESPPGVLCTVPPAITAGPSGGKQCARPASLTWAYQPKRSVAPMCPKRGHFLKDDTGLCGHHIPLSGCCLNLETLEWKKSPYGCYELNRAPFKSIY